MERYDYRKAICSDIRVCLDSKRHMTEDDIFRAVTGTGTGTGCGWRTEDAKTAADNLRGNGDLIKAAAFEFGYTVSDFVAQDVREIDRIIRCFVFGDSYNDALNARH